MITTILLVALCMSLFCLAMYTMMQDGHIFNFMRQPIVDRMEADKAQRDKELTAQQTARSKAKKDSITAGDTPEYREAIMKVFDAEAKDLVEEWDRKLKAYDKWKPIVLCPLCFSSFWGSMVFFMANWYMNFHPWNWWILPVWAFTCAITVLFNGILNAVCNKLEVY